MSWNKGYTKFTHPSLLKMSETLKRRGIDNLKSWRLERKKRGLVPKGYPAFKKSSELAELIGVILGDGNISKFPRTERLIITGNANNPGFIDRYSLIVERIFNKKPRVSKVSTSNAVRISIYQNKIEHRLKIPSGNKLKKDISIPSWIKSNKEFLIATLKGLFEAEASLTIHNKTYTYNFQFSNRNASILKFVHDSLLKLGFNPEVRRYYIRLRRKKEVMRFKNMINFRSYQNKVV